MRLPHDAKSKHGFLFVVSVHQHVCGMSAGADQAKLLDNIIFPKLGSENTSYSIFRVFAK